MTVIQVDIIELYLFNRYNQRRDSMIIGFKDKETEKIYHQSFSKRFSPFIQRLALRKLMLLDNADSYKIYVGHRETDWNCSKEIALVSIVYELIASIGYVLK